MLSATSLRLRCSLPCCRSPVGSIPWHNTLYPTVGDHRCFLEMLHLGCSKNLETVKLHTRQSSVHQSCQHLWVDALLLFEACEPDSMPQVTQLLVANIQSLAQLEADLSSPEMVRLCTRLTGDLKKGQMEQLDRKVLKKFGAACLYKKLAEKMLKTKLAYNSETGLKELEDGPWPLAVQSMYHWSSKAQKNQK